MNFQVARSCSRKAALNEKLQGGKNKYYTLSKVVKEVIEKLTFKEDKSTIRKMVESAYQDIGDGFSHEFELEANLQNLTDCFERWVEWEKNQAMDVVKRKISETVTAGGEIHKVYADLLVDRDTHYELIRVFRGKPKMTKRGRTIDTNPIENIDLYLLDLMGNNLLSYLPKDLPIKASFYYLKSKSDKNGYFSLNFEAKPGENIITTSFSIKEADHLENVIQKTEAKIEKRVDECDCTDCSYADICNAAFVPREMPEPDIHAGAKYQRIKVTKEQEKLITARDGCYRVNAVAGSGKTTVIALRTLSLLEEEEEAKNILMITFTDKAREEMRTKIRGFNKAFYEGWDLKVDDLNIETFNSWGHSIIGDFHKNLGFSQSPNVIDDLTKRDIIVKLLEEAPKLPLNYENPFMDLPYAKGAVLEMAKIIDTLKASDVKTKEEVVSVLKSNLDSKWYQKEGVVLNIYNKYNEELVNKNVVDYEDQLRLLVKLEPLGVFNQFPYEHIVIDEFQDSNPNQIAIIEKIMDKNKRVRSLLVVGDVMQAIYSFRNTSPENLLSFGNKFSDVTDINLTENFRSDRGITEWANAILDKEAKLPTKMRPFKSLKKEPEMKIYEKLDKGVEMMVEQVSEWVIMGTPLSSITVLGRTKAELNRYQKALSQNGFDSVLKVPEILKENAYVKAVFALIKFLMNEDDIKSLTYYAKAKGIDPFDFKKVNELGEELKKEILNQETEPEKINALFVELESITKEDYAAKDFVEKVLNVGSRSLYQVFQYISKYDAYEVKEAYRVKIPDTDAVQLITVHSAKGLEYPNVIVMLEKFKNTEEEKRLFYVAITRAEEELLVLANRKQTALTSLLTKNI